MKHQTHIPNYPDHKKLAEEIGNLRYDSLAEFFIALHNKMVEDESADHKRKRFKLSSALYGIHYNLKWCIESAKKAWEISKPYTIIEENLCCVCNNKIDLSNKNSVEYRLCENCEKNI